MSKRLDVDAVLVYASQMAEQCRSEAQTARTLNAARASEAQAFVLEKLIKNIEAIRARE